MKLKEFIHFAISENKINMRQLRIRLDYSYDTDMRTIFNAPDGSHFHNIHETIDALGYELVARKKSSNPLPQNETNGYVIDYEMDERRYKRIQKRIEERIREGRQLF